MSHEAAARVDSTEGILFHLRDYLHVRAVAAGRMNPRIANVVEDIVWVQLEQMRAVLDKAKSYGPERVRTSDVLTGEDETRRKAVLSHTDQNAVVYEVINRPDQQQGRVMEMAIHDTRTLFRALDPSLEFIVQLVQHWSYWDLPDAADLHHFEMNARRLRALTSVPISEDLRHRYLAALHKKADDVLTDEDIVKLELHLLENIMGRFSQRRAEEEAYMMIIQRDPIPGEGTEKALGAPYDYKKKQVRQMAELFAREQEHAMSAVQGAAPVASPEPSPSAAPEVEVEVEHPAE